MSLSTPMRMVPFISAPAGDDIKENNAAVIVANLSMPSSPALAPAAPFLQADAALPRAGRMLSLTTIRVKRLVAGRIVLEGA
jgi:hypothetical protein